MPGRKKIFNRVLTFEDACKYTGYSYTYLKKLTGAGKIPHSKPNGGTVYFDREQLEQWMLSKPIKTREDRAVLAATYETTRKTKSI